ncbi:MAG: dTMP kinase [Deltaproteobacteria bacterium]|nr:MAG: dTMP kinase [Deltaproteobacteria bacterium]
MSKGKKSRGRFIVLEGIDGAGTTTQQARIVDWLRDRGMLAQGTREPSEGPIGSLIRQILRGRLVTAPPSGKVAPVDPAAVALLFAADRVDHLTNEIVPLLESGWHVVCDRYVVSSLAYQSLETDLRFVRQINEKAIAPDLTIYLKVRPEVAMARIESSRAGRESFEKLAIQKKVAAAYDDILGSYRGGRVVTIDGEQVVSTVTQAVRSAIEDLLA